MIRTIIPAVAAVCVIASSVSVGANSLVAPGMRSGIAKSKLSATSAGEWNRLSRVDGKNVEVWTADGDALNKVTFYGGIESGKPLVKETDQKHHPLPKISPTILITDIPSLLETTYRSLGAVNQMNVGEEAPATLAGRKAIRFAYTLTRSDDEVRRKGEGIGALVDGKLYLVTYEAPALHFFEKDVQRYRELAASLSL